MNIKDLPQGSYQIAPSPMQTAQQNLLARPPLNAKKLSFDQSQAALAQSQALADKVFKSPLQNIASGASGDNIQHAIGAGKQALADISSAGAQNAGPVGADMLAHAPAFAENIHATIEALKPSNISQAQGAAETSLGETIAPLGGTVRSSPLIGGAVAKVGETLKGIGKTIYSSIIPRSAREAQLVQAYKANTPLAERLKIAMTGSPTQGPRTLAETAFEQGIKGTESSMGVQAKRASQNIWKEVIEPQLKDSKSEVDMPSFFNELEQQIIQDTPELSRQKSLIEGLNALREDYAGVGSVPLEKLQDLKSGWAEFIPEKSYQGKPIAGAFKDVTAKAADKARQAIYDTLGPDVREAYLDYGNLKSLEELGQKAMTGGRLKGGFGGFWSGIKDITLTPVATVGGRVLYRTGEGLEFVGQAGAKTLADIDFIKHLRPTQDGMPQESQAPLLERQSSQQ